MIPINITYTNYLMLDRFLRPTGRKEHDPSNLNVATTTLYVKAMICPMFGNGIYFSVP